MTSSKQSFEVDTFRAKENFFTVKQPSPLNPKAIPQQLVVPIHIKNWYGKAIMDTGASYTLMHENLWAELNSSRENLKPWCRGPLYLANGEAESPLGWTTLDIEIQGNVINASVAVLPSKALAYGIVLGLDFIYHSQLQINVADQVYGFKHTPSITYPFQPGSASISGWKTWEVGNHKGSGKPKHQLGLISSIPPPGFRLKVDCLGVQDYINHAVSSANLQTYEKPQI